MLFPVSKMADNQYIVPSGLLEKNGQTYTGSYFQSYDSIIVFHAMDCSDTGNCDIKFLDEKYWEYSKTTGRYRNQFLGERYAETKAKIESGEYILTNLNPEF